MTIKSIIIFVNQIYHTFRKCKIEITIERKLKEDAMTTRRGKQAQDKKWKGGQNGRIKEGMRDISVIL